MQKSIKAYQIECFIRKKITNSVSHFSFLLCPFFLGGGGVGVISINFGYKGGGPKKILMKRRGGIMYYRSYRSNPAKTSLYVCFSPQKTLETLQLLTEPKMWGTFTFSRNVHLRESQNLTFPTILCSRIQHRYRTSQGGTAEG